MISFNAVASDSESVAPSSSENEDDFFAQESEELPEPAGRDLSESLRKLYMKQAVERLSPALLHIVQQPTVKRRDRALAAFVALIYGPTPFGGANTLKEVAVRYSMTEQNLHALMNTGRSLLEQPTRSANFERAR